jgi:NAD+ synthase (glutamine-hydrolysing)
MSPPSPRAWPRASGDGADLLVCPNCRCAYYPGDLFEDAAFLRAMQQALDTLLQASTRWPALVTVIGTARPNPGVGKPLYNALLALRDGRIVAEYYKQLLPTYGIFDEGRHFEPGRPAPAPLRSPAARWVS